MMKKAIILTTIAFLAVGCAQKQPDYTAQLDAISKSVQTSAEKAAPDKQLATIILGYQSVFLTNGQVYFGKLSVFNNEYMQLTDIYYLQNGGVIQNGTGSNPNEQLSLVKLGAELHGPEDTMYIPKTQVQFFENLKADSKVVQAINEYKRVRK